jgi:RNA polymerase sigma factor for flagellar operon FliA
MFDSAAPAPDAQARPHDVSSLGTVSSVEVTAYMHLVRATVAQFLKRLPSTVQRDDLLSAGAIGLADALAKHRGERGPKFEWYARVRIRGAIFDELRRQDWLSRHERARVAGSSPDGVGPTMVAIDDVGESLLAVDTRNDDLIERRSAQLELWRGVARLPPRERTIVELHYGSGVQFNELAKKLGVSAPRISQLHARAILMLREIVQGLAEGDATVAA